MELNYIDGRCFEFKSNRLQFFIDEKGSGLIESAMEQSKNGKYIYHIFLYYFDDRGAARRIKIGRVFGPYNLHQDSETFLKFRNECFDLLQAAEKTNSPFKQVLDITFGVKK